MTTAPLSTPVANSLAGSRRPTSDLVLGVLARSAAAIVVLMLGALVLVLLLAAWPSVREFGASFLVGTEWRVNELSQPALGPDGKVLIEDGETVMRTLPPVFGALPVIYGTFVSSFIALVVAVPLSLGAAIFIVRVAPRLKVAGPVSFLVEFLASIPSIAYGLWGLFVLAPFLQNHVEPVLRSSLGKVPGFAWMFTQSVEIAGVTTTRDIPSTGRNMLAGGLILAVMIIPIITAVSRDVLKSVPRGQIEGSLALGATWWQSCWGMLGYARSGLFGGVMLGLARAAGETMAVVMVIGNSNHIVPSPLAPAQTMSGLLVNEFNEAERGSLHQSSLLLVALILLAMSLAFNIVARRLVVGQEGRQGD